MSSVIRKQTAEFLLDLAAKGIPIGEQHKQVLRGKGLGKELSKLDSHEKKPLDDITDGRGHLWLTEDQAKGARDREEKPDKNAACYLTRIPKAWKDKWKGKDISKSDWAPRRPDLHTKEPEFRAFISSHIPRFDQITPYEMFWLYIEQALRWLAEDRSLVDIDDPEEQRWYALEEFRRIDENKLYGANKYGYIKDDEYPGGWRKYLASTPQALLMWIIDAGFSTEAGKGRQGAFTSTVMEMMALTMITRPSFKGVLVTDDVEFTGKNIFEDKLRACYKVLVDRNTWLRPLNVPGWSAKKITFDWSEGTRKDEKGTFTSDFSLAASNETQTINGTTPSIVVFDETQNIPTYQDIKLEARPTMLSNIDGVLRVRRQLVAYGTGSRKQTGNGSFENEYKSTLDKWQKFEDTSSFVPLFFDWTCRPGITKEDYLQEYNFYMTSQEEGMTGLSTDERASVFYSAYPSRPDDMFMSSHKTIVPMLVIMGQQDQIVKYGASSALVRGHFEPIYDQNRPMPPGSAHPFFIHGASWVPTPHLVDSPVRMLSPPKKNWLRRYFQGTDPIQSAAGSSQFSSAIFDAVGGIEVKNDQILYHPAPICILNDRPPIVGDAFDQSILMGMYYANHGQRACQELLEINQGQSYELWKKDPSYNLEDSLIFKNALPKHYTGGQHIYGIDLKGGKGSRKGRLLNELDNFVLDHGTNIWYYDWWTQIRNMEVIEKPDGSKEWGARKGYNDDMVFSVIYAYIACLSEARQPEELNFDKPNFELRRIQKRNPQTHELYYVQERVQPNYA